MPEVTPAAQATTGSVLTATEYNKLPRGVVFRNTITAAQNGIGTGATDMTNFSATWTATSSHLYRTTIFVPQVLQNTSTGTTSIVIADGSNNQISIAYMQQVTGAQFAMIVQAIETSLSGSITRKGRASTTANTINLVLASTAPGFILVEDLGLA